MKKTEKKILSVSCILSVLCTMAAITPSPAGAEQAGPLFINEICAKNTEYAAPDGKFYDWAEIWNSSSESIDISGYGISDTETKPYKFTFAEGTKISGGEHLVVFFNSDNTAVEGANTAFFGLSTDGETLTLTDRDGNKADSVTFGAIDANVSFGRTKDGASELAVMAMTPGAENKSESVIQKVVQSPSFSAPSGFYSSSFDLTLSAGEGAKIYFTVDSSTPDKNSTEYTGAISISNAMSAARQSQKKPDGGREPGGPEAGQRPEDGKPENNTAAVSGDAAVIRAVAYDSEGNMSEPVTAVYFIGYENKASYYRNMKIISIVTDSKNLFDRQTGIWQNYDKSGSEWERPANMQIFSGGKRELYQNIGIRIHGGYTRRFEQKSLNVYARSEYGKSTIDYDLFSGTLRSESTGKKIKDFDSFILRNAGNDCQDTRFRDKLNQTLADGRSFLKQAMEPCVVFINGQFYGHYEITEKISEDYIKAHTGVSKKNVCIVKNQELDEGSEETFAEYQSLAEWIRKTDLSSAENYAKLCSMVDIDSFIDYMSTEIYIANKDWGKNNMAMWKSSVTDSSNPYSDGRWRFILFDTEFSSNIYNTVPANINIFSNLTKEENFLGTLLNAAMKNSEFREKFSTAFMDIANSNFASDRVNALISQYTEMYRDVVNDTEKKFWGTSKFSGAVSTVKSWFGSRYSYAVSQLKSAAGLKGNLNSVTVNNNCKYGTVKVNTLTPDFSSGSYTGKYYSDYKITLSAEPADGYTFAGWKLNDGSVIKGRTAQISLNGNTQVTAMYSSGEGDITETVSGDTNGDGTVNAADAVTLASYLSGRNVSVNPASADMNGDGRISILDMILLKNRLI